MKLQLLPCRTCWSLSTPLAMLHYQVDLQIGMEYLHLGRVTFGFLPTCKIGTLIWSSTELCAGTSAFYPIHYTTQHYCPQFWHKPPSLCRWYSISSLSISNAMESLEKLQHCVMAVSTWMTGSELKVNHSKTDFFSLGSSFSDNNSSTIPHA